MRESLQKNQELEQKIMEIENKIDELKSSQITDKTLQQENKKLKEEKQTLLNTCKANVNNFPKKVKVKIYNIFFISLLLYCTYQTLIKLGLNKQQTSCKSHRTWGAVQLFDQTLDYILVKI